MFKLKSIVRRIKAWLFPELVLIRVEKPKPVNDNIVEYAPIDAEYTKQFRDSIGYSED